MPAPLPRSVKLLGFTSLFTDAATEAIYPLLPIFVTRVLGGNPAALGVIEGAAAATASVLRIVSGYWSDRTGRRKPFVLAGYTIAGLVRPLISLATTWQQVFIVRIADRVGKGLRGAPRDAMLGTLATSNNRGRVYGFHRAMDHGGAVIGPIAATVFLWFMPGAYRTLFALAIVPGVLAILMLLFIPEVTVRGATGATGASGASGGAGARRAAGAPSLPPALRRYLMILTIFMLGNSSDAFLLLRLSDAGVDTVFLPLSWAALHVVKASLSTFGGTLSDRFGRRRLIISGWVLYAIVYGGFAVSDSLAALLAWLMVYGVHFALVEGSERALVADLVSEQAQGAAFGWYNAVIGFGTLSASVVFGFLWQTYGAPIAFYTGAALAITAAAALAADRSLALPS